MIDATSLLGSPRTFQDLCTIYPPKVKDVVFNPDYGIYTNLLMLSQEDIEDIITNHALAKDQEIPDINIPTPLEFLMINCYDNQEAYTKALDAFQLFIHEEVLILFDQKKIILGELSNELKPNTKFRVLDEDNFFDFQNALRVACGGEPVEFYKPSQDIRIRRIKAKARYRDKIKAKKGKGINLGDSLTAICCMNMGLNPLNIGELSYGSVPILVSAYQKKEKYELDIQSLMAGADSKKIKPKYWIGDTN